MNKEVLGAFEEMVMLITALLDKEAYGLAIVDEIKRQTGKKATIGAVHSTVARLEKKGLLETYMGGATKERGGRRKRFIRITNAGKTLLIASRDTKVNLWSQIPDLAIKSI
jgi:DNA-binding PadR family transcriptional regulator